MAVEWRGDRLLQAKEVGETFAVFDVEDAVEPRAAKVRIDQENALVDFRQGYGKIRGEGGFPFPGSATRDYEDMGENEG